MAEIATQLVCGCLCAADIRRQAGDVRASTGFEQAAAELVAAHHRLLIDALLDIASVPGEATSVTAEIQA